MGLLDKVKNLFTEEVEEDVVPVRQEVKKTEPVREFKPVSVAKTMFDDEEDDFDIRPTKSIEKEETKTREEKFVYFTDDDFKDLEKPKPKVEEYKPKEIKKEEVKKEEIKKTVSLYSGSPVKPAEQKKAFKPSPIISPVYGVLDKDYTKDEIKVKSSPRIYKSTITIDEVKDKNTTIEDDINDEVLGKALIETTKVKEKDTNINIFDELEKEEEKNNKDMDLIFDNLNDKLDTIEKEINEETEEKNTKSDVDLAKSLLDEDEDETIALAEELALQKEKIEKINDLMEENEKITKNKNKNKKKKEDTEEDELEESELFDLIDSMYEKKDDE